MSPKQATVPNDPANNMVPVDQNLLETAGVVKLTLINWMKNYQVDGKNIGMKVGGRWRVNKDLLKRFLNGEGEKIIKGEDDAKA